MKTSSSMLFASLAVVAACGGSGKKDPPLNVIDAPVSVDAPAVTCTAPATFATAANFTTKAYSPDTDPDVTGSQEGWRMISDVNTDPMPDQVWIELFEGPPPAYTTANFPATPFTVQLTGAELDYFTCSMCITLSTDDDPANMAYADDFMATGGSVTITTLSPTMVEGTLNNITFKQVEFDFDTGMQTDVTAGNCVSASAASVPFSTPVMQPPPAFNPNGATTGRRGFGLRLRH